MDLRIKKWFAPLLFIVNAGVILYIWLGNSGGGIRTGSLSSTAIAIGNLAGLFAFYFALWQLLLIGRVPWIEKPWGHDKLSRIHHILGLCAVGLLLFHPPLLIYGYSKEAQLGFISQFIFFLNNFDDILLALTGYLLFITIIILSLWIIRKRLKYEVWYIIHLMLYLAIIFTYQHQSKLGRDLATPSIQLYWQVLFYGTLLTIIYARFAKPLWNFWKYQFVVSEVRAETPDVNSVIITGKNLERLPAKAGQFIIVRFFAKNFWWEAHPFSLSEVPNGTRLRLSIKAVGDFTKKIPQLPPNTRVLLEGPLGRFTGDKVNPEDTIALIAGGIGITPLRSLVEAFAKEQRTVDLIYAARTETDFALKAELDTIAANQGHIKLHYAPENITGRLSAELIRQYIPDIAQRKIYLCGPPPMMKAVRVLLQSLGAPEKYIFFEKFQLG